MLRRVTGNLHDEHGENAHLIQRKINLLDFPIHKNLFPDREVASR
jgi:hypothetical protein